MPFLALVFLFKNRSSQVFTDIVQGMATILFLAVFLFWMVSHVNVDVFQENLQRSLINPLENNFLDNLYFGVVLFVSGITAISGGADLWQRMFSANSPSSIRSGMLGSTFLYIIFGLLLSLVSVQISGVLPLADPNLAFEIFLKEQVPLFVLSMASVGLFAALISTADAELLVISICLSREAHRLGLNKVVEIKDTRKIAFFISVITALFAVFTRDKLAEVFSILLFVLMITGPIAWVVLFNRGRSLFLSLGILFSIGFFLILWRFDMMFTALWALIIPVPISLNLLLSAKENPTNK